MRVFIEDLAGLPFVTRWLGRGVLSDVLGDATAPETVALA